MKIADTSFKYIYIFLPFCQKMCTYLDTAKRKEKSSNIENFDQTSEKQTPPDRGQF